MLDVLKYERPKKEEDIPKSQIDIKKIQEHILEMQKPKDRKRKDDVKPKTKKPSVDHQYRQRRPNGAGAVFFRKHDQRWCGRIKVGIDLASGKTRFKNVYGHSAEEVIKKLAKVKNNILFYENEYASTSTIGKLMKDWLLLFKKNTVSSRTFEGYIRNFKIHIEPIIGGMKLNEVDKFVVKYLINKMHDSKYAIDTIKKVKHTIGQFFEYAIENEWVAKNPTDKIVVRNVNNLPNTKNQYKAVEPEFRNNVLGFLDKEQYTYMRPLCKLLMFGGLRIGEALALNWKNINFDKQTINIEKGMTEEVTFDQDGNITSRKTIIGNTKTMCSVREIPLPSIVFEELMIWREHQASKNLPNLVERNSFVFAKDDGEFRKYHTTRRKFDKFKARHKEELEGVGFHGLRHTFSNMLFEMKENPKAIQQLLGHKDVKTTIMVYNSVNTSYVNDTRDRLNDVVIDKYQTEN